MNAIYGPLKKLDPKSVPLIFAALLLLVAAVLFTYGIKPVLNEHKTLTQSSEALAGAVNEESVLSLQIAQMETQIQALHKALYGQDGSLPLRQIEGHIIGKLQDISWNHKIDLLSIRPANTSSVLQFEEIPFEVEIAGNYFQFFAWLQQIGRELGFVVIKRYDITPLSSLQHPDRLKMTLTMVTYRTQES